MQEYVLLFLVPLIISLVITPFMIKFAIIKNIIDVPKDDRRVHNKPIPLAGGMAIYLSFLISTIIFVPLTKEVLGLTIGGAIITFAGLIDDIKPLKPSYKLIIQIAVAVILILFGIRIEFITNPFNKLTGMSNIGWLSIPATIFWLVGVTNAFNLIDGLDGLAAGTATISCITLFIISILNGRIIAALMTITLAGSIIGFLPYNFYPARVFMGDTGSQFLGFILAAISLQGAIKSAAAIAVVVPVLALGLPIYDTLIAIIRRYINNKPVMQGDKEHLHHKLLQMGLSQRKVVILMYTINILLGIAAVIATEISTVYSFIMLFLVICIVFFTARKLGLLKKNKE